MYDMFSACLRAGFAALVLKNAITYPPPPEPYISKMAFSQRFRKIYTYPLLQNEILMQGTKKKPKKCEFAPRWRIPDDPERYFLEASLDAS